MGKRVAIVGVGMSKSGTSAVPSWELFASAALQAVKEAEIDLSRIQALHLGNVYSSFTEMQTNMAELTSQIKWPSSRGLRWWIPS